MKIHVFGGIAVVGMALTSAIVWSATSEKSERVARPALASTTPISHPGEITPKSDPAQPEHFVDRSSFTAGETLMMEGRLGHPVLPAQSQSETYLFIDVTADATKSATVNTPLALSIVIDRSGSMRGKRLDNALDAARTAIDQLRDGDTVSVLTYNTRTEVVVPSTIIASDNRDAIKKKLRTVRAGGDTCISCGVESGMRLLGASSMGMNQRMSRRHHGMGGHMDNGMAANPGPVDAGDGVSRVLLLSDGEATHGIRDVEGFGRIADRARELGVSITSIGVDLDYNERVMAALARRSNGRHYFVESAVDLPQIFQQEMDSLAKTIASRTELRVTLAPGVSLEHVFDRSFELTGNGVTVNMGAFTAGENKTLLMRLRVPRGQAGERPIADARLAYRDLVKGNDAASCQGELVARATDDPSQVSPLDGLVSMRLSRSETAEALEQANALFASGRAQEARTLLKDRTESLEKTKADGWMNAPMARRGDFDADMSRQSAAIGGALDEFDKAGAEAEASGGAAKASSTRRARKQVRMNQEAAFDMGL